MSESIDRVSLGARVSEGKQHTVHRVRDISEEVAIELEAKFRTVREMAEPSSDARVNASATRLLALFGTAESEREEDGAISALTQAEVRASRAGGLRPIRRRAHRAARGGRPWSRERPRGAGAA